MRRFCQLIMKFTNGQYCFIKVIIKQKGDEIIKEEVMECADGKKRQDGLGYWDLFANSIITTQPICHNIVGIIADKDTLLNHTERCVFNLTENGRSYND